MTQQEMLKILIHNDEEAHKALEFMQIVIEHLDARIRALETIHGEESKQIH